MLSCSSSFEPKYLGLVDYNEALNLQHELHSLCLSKQQQYIIALEHPTVLTLGVRAHNVDLKNLVINSWDYPVFKIHRGGLATIHNPGQLVIYPIINLKACGLSVKQFVNQLFLATQKTLVELGIESSIDLCNQPGVYTGMGKIAFCGLQIKNGVTMHGLSINLNNDVQIFEGIQSCGVMQPKIDSVAKHNIQCTTKDFFSLWLKNFNLEPQQTSCEMV